MFEKTVKKRSFLLQYKISFTKQFGFTQSKSTQNAIIALINEIIKGIDALIPTLHIFVDFKKTFDTVSHLQLLGVLKGIATRGMIWRVILKVKNYV